MPTLVLLSKDTVDNLNAEEIPLSVVKDANKMFDVLSAQDLAEACLAVDHFPFAFDPQLNITLAEKPLTVLNSTNNTEVSVLRDRVRERYETLKLKAESDVDEYDVFTLYPIDESVWVVAWQRQRSENNDPTANHSSQRAFFDEMIAQCLHLMTFSAVSKTNLMTYYLKTLP